MKGAYLNADKWGEEEEEWEKEKYRIIRDGIRWEAELILFNLNNACSSRVHEYTFPLK